MVASRSARLVVSNTLVVSIAWLLFGSGSGTALETLVLFVIVDPFKAEGPNDATIENVAVPPESTRGLVQPIRVAALLLPTASILQDQPGGAVMDRRVAEVSNVSKSAALKAG